MTNLIPNAELVAQAWLVAAVSGLTASQVATTLPDPPWPGNEFVQVTQVGGTPDIYTPVMESVVSVNCFAIKSSSLKPPWGQAAQLAMRIWEATFPVRYAPHAAVVATMPKSGYSQAHIRTVVAVSQPKRIPSDPSQYAVYNLDLQFSWSVVGMTVARS